MFNIDIALSRLANVIVSAAGNGFDPDGSPLPAFRTRTPPSIEVPRKPKRKAVEVDDDTMYTDEEIEAMSAAEFAIKVGGAKTKEAFYSIKSEPKKTREVDFDTVDSDDHGITEREYGEMRAYVPTLTDLALAAKVKAGKAAGKSLRRIAEETRQTYQTIRHYSAALGRANS